MHCWLKSFRFAWIALILIMLAGTTGANEILVIDLSVANKITVSTTGANAQADTSGGFDDIYFADFYYGVDNPGAGAFGTRLDFANDGTSLTTFDPNLGIEPAADYAYFSRSGGNDPGLHLGDWTTYSSIDFSTTRAAFLGSSTWDLDPTYFEPMLAGGNRSGDVYHPASDVSDIGSTTVIGQYSVIVPEPSSLALLGVGALLIVRRRRS